MAIAEKRKATGLPDIGSDSLAIRKTKRSKQEIEVENVKLEQKIADTRLDAINLLVQQMRNGTDRIYQSIYGEHWQEGKKFEEQKLLLAQEAHRSQQDSRERNKELTTQKERADLMGNGIFKDDYDPRY